MLAVSRASALALSPPRLTKSANQYSFSFVSIWYTPFASVAGSIGKMPSACAAVPFSAALCAFAAASSCAKATVGSSAVSMHRVSRMHKTHFFILFSSVFMCGVHPKTGRNQLCRLRRSANFAGRIEKHQADAYYTDTLYTKQKKTGAFFAKCRFFGAKCNFAATAVHHSAALCCETLRTPTPVHRPFPRQFSFPFNVSLLRSNFILFLRNKTGVFQARKEETHLSAFMHKHWFYSLVFFVQTILHTPLMLNG